MKRSLVRVVITTALLLIPGLYLSGAPSPASAGSEAMGDQVAKILAAEAEHAKIKVMVMDLRVSVLNADQKQSDVDLKELSARSTEEFVADVMQKLRTTGRQDRVAMIDRGRVEEILRDKKVPITGTAERTPLELAALAGVDVVITGSMQVSGKASTGMVKVVRVKDGEILGFVKQGDQERPSRPAAAPITVIDNVEKIEIGEWKALPVNLANPGTLSVAIDVERGNAIDVVVIPGQELEHLKGNKEFAQVSAFAASKVRHFQRTADVENGSYYLVLRDSSVGVFSKMRSEIKVMVRLEP